MKPCISEKNAFILLAPFILIIQLGIEFQVENHFRSETWEALFHCLLASRVLTEKSGTILILNPFVPSLEASFPSAWCQEISHTAFNEFPMPWSFYLCFVFFPLCWALGDSFLSVT